MEQKQLNSINHFRMEPEDKNTSTIVFTEGKYGLILLDTRNWIVAELIKPLPVQAEPCSKDFSTNSYSYHSNIRQALKNMADRMTKDAIKKSCKVRSIDLKTLIEIIKENDEWMKKAIVGYEKNE